MRRFALLLALMPWLGLAPAPAALAAEPAGASAYRTADRQLNQAWPAALAATKRRHTEAKLLAAQLAWVAFKEAEGKALAHAKPPGQAWAWLRTETQARTDFLQAVARGPIPPGSPTEEGTGTTAQYFAREDRRLNEVWRAVLGQDTWRAGAARQARIQAQLAWIRYRDAQASYLAADGGSDLSWVMGRLSAQRSIALGD